jgi:hypothetical protein
MPGTCSSRAAAAAMVIMSTLLPLMAATSAGVCAIMPTSQGTSVQMAAPFVHAYCHPLHAPPTHLHLHLHFRPDANNLLLGVEFGLHPSEMNSKHLACSLHACSEATQINAAVGTTRCDMARMAEVLPDQGVLLLQLPLLLAALNHGMASNRLPLAWHPSTLRLAVACKPRGSEANVSSSSSSRVIDEAEGTVRWTEFLSLLLLPASSRGPSDCGEASRQHSWAMLALSAAQAGRLGGSGVWDSGGDDGGDGDSSGGGDHQAHRATLLHASSGEQQQQQQHQQPHPLPLSLLLLPRLQLQLPTQLDPLSGTRGECAGPGRCGTPAPWLARGSLLLCLLLLQALALWAAVRW